jgi:polar amino acid transport system substrate-binding protein
MKKIIALLLVAVFCFACLAACGTEEDNGTSESQAADNSEAEVTGKLAEVKKAGKLVIATSPDFPPFENLEGGEVVGIEIDIMNIICEKLGVELVIEQMNFDAVLPGIQAKKFDVGVSGITITPDREKTTLFSLPYYNAAQVIVVKEGSEIKGKDDLEGKTVSVQTGTTAESGCKEMGLTCQAFEANADAKAALTTDKVDAWVVDNLTAIEMLEEGDGLVILEGEVTTEPYAFAFAKDSETLVTEINKIIVELSKNGEIEKIFNKYGIEP